jgi:hypothetical protein
MFKPGLDRGRGQVDERTVVKAFNFENYDSNHDTNGSMGMIVGDLQSDNLLLDPTSNLHPDNRKIYLSGIPKNADVDSIR